MAQTLGGWPVPSGYNAMRVTASGRKGARRWEITRASKAMDEDGWIGDIVHFMPENVWSAQPSAHDAEDTTDYKQPQDAFAALVREMTDASDITRAYLAGLDSPALAGMLRDYAGQIEQPHSTLAALLTEAADRLDSAAATEPGLREHCAEFHPRITLRGQSDDRVSAEHGRQHFQHGSATHHHGPNPGPHARPRGWRDGSGVVLVNLRNAMRRGRTRQQPENSG